MKTYFVVKWGANRCSQVLVTYVLTLCTIILCFKLVSAFGFKIHLCQVMACETALGKGRAERVEERQESPGGSGKGGAGISPGVPKCLARAAGLVAVGLRQWFALLAHSGIGGTAQTWERPKFLAAWSEIGAVFPSLVASAWLPSS